MPDEDPLLPPPPRADVSIFYSGPPAAGVNAFLQGAAIQGQASAVSAFQTSNPIDVEIIGAAIVGEGGAVTEAQPLQLNPLMHWDNQREVDEGTTSSPLPEIPFIMRTHRESGGLGSNSIVEIKTTNPLRFGGGPYLHTQLTQGGGTPSAPVQSKRCERHPIGAYIANIGVIDIGGGHRRSLNDWWYAFRMRIDRCPDTIDGIYCQWHDQQSSGGTKRPAITMSGSLNGMRLEQLDMPGGNRVTPRFISGADFVGSNHKYIWRIRWDTRDTAGTTGLVELYLDDDSTPVFSIADARTAHPFPNTDNRAPFFKYGLYKSNWQFFGTPGDQCEQSYDDGIIEVEDVGDVTDMRASIAALMDLNGVAGNP